MIDENQILDPKEGLDYYVYAFKSALDNNPDVIDYMNFDNKETEFQVLVEKSTKDIDNEMYNFDTSLPYDVTNLAKTTLDYDAVWCEDYDDGLVVSLSLVPHDRDWNPIHPFEVDLDEDTDKTFYEGLAYLFGGEKSDYIYEHSDWVQKAREMY